MLELSNEELYNKAIATFLSLHPHVRVGDPMPKICCFARGGRASIKPFFQSYEIYPSARMFIVNRSTNEIIPSNNCVDRIKDDFGQVYLHEYNRGIISDLKILRDNSADMYFFLRFALSI